MTLFLLFFLSFFHKLEDKKIIETAQISIVGKSHNYSVVMIFSSEELDDIFR